MILLNPGPVNVSDRVRKALSREDICHREEEFSRLLEGIRLKLLKAFAPGGSHAVIVLTGSGTAAVEAAVSSALGPDRKILIINNGVYGERIARMAAAYGMKQLEMRFEWQSALDLSRIEQVLARDPAIQVVAMVHHETTTGLINPVDRVSDLVHRYDKRLLVDSVSGLGGEAIGLVDNSVDLCVGTAGKCLQGFPGVSFVIVKKDEMRRIETIPPRSVYLSLADYFRDQERGTVPFTPAVQLHFALDEALNELLEEGVNGRISRYREAARMLRQGYAALGLKLLLPEGIRSNTITGIYLPEGMTYEKLHHALKRRGYVIYAGQGNLESRIFRVANMGALGKADFEAFLKSVGEVLA